MRIIHKVRNVNSTALTLKLPKFLLDKTVEITIATVPGKNEDIRSIQRRKRKLNKILNSISYHIPQGYNFDRNELHER